MRDQSRPALSAERLEDRQAGQFIVLDRNIFEIPVDDLNDTLVERTIVGGEVVFDRDAAEKELSVIKVEITNKDLDNAVLWAYDPETKQAVEVLRVSDRAEH